MTGKGKGIITAVLFTVVVAVALLAPGKAMAQQDCMIGEVKYFAGNFAPRSWAFAEGQLLPISQNQALFSILGTIYGGDGRTTFALPDLRGRAIIGPGNGPGLSSYREGQRGGVETVTLTTTQVPNHNHTISAALPASDAQGTQAAPAYPAAGRNFYGSSTNTTLPVSVSATSSGGGQSHENRQPYLAIYPIICLFGTFPSR